MFEPPRMADSWSWYEFCCYILSFPTYCRCKLMRCFCFPSIFENSNFWKRKFVIFIIFLEMFQNPKSWCFLFQPQFRNVLKATNNSLYPFFQDFPEFEVLEINKKISGKFEIFVFSPNFKLGNPILPNSHFTWRK